MGIKELGHLKKSLSNIESNTKKSQKLEKAIWDSGSEIESLTSQIEKIRPQLESAEQIARRKEEISKLEATKAAREASVEKAVSEVKKKGAVEGFPNMMFKSAEVKIKKEVKEKRKGRNAQNAFLIFVVLAISGTNVYLNIYDHFLPWTCDNGEVIEQTSLLDGVNDCSDGSDEKEYFWTNSRAQDSNVEFTGGFCLLAIAFLSVVFMLVVKVASVDDISRDLRLYPGYAEALKENQRLQRILDGKRARLKIIYRELDSPSKELKRIEEELPEKLVSLENALANQEKQKLELESEAASVAEETDALWEGIRHLVPHSNLL